MVGQFSLALAIAMPVIAMTNLQVRTLLATDARREFGYGNYFTTRLITAAIGLAIVVLIVAITDYPTVVDAIVIALTIARTLDSLSDVPYGLLQQRERMDRVGLSLGLHGLLQLGSFAAALLLTGNLLAAVIASALTSAALLLLFDVPGVRAYQAATDTGAASTTAAWSKQAFLRLVWLGLPISLVTAVNSLTGNVPRYFIAESLGDRELGIFAAMFYLTVAGSMVTGAISDPASPRLARLAAEHDLAGFRSLLSKLMTIAVIIAVAGLMIAVVAGKPLLGTVYRPEYSEYSTAFIWLMAAAIPTYAASVLGVGVNALRRFHAQVPLPIINLAVTIALAASLIPSRGIDGAAQVIFAGATLSMLTTAALLVYCLRTTGRGHRT